METLKKYFIETISNGDWDKFSLLAGSSQEDISELSKNLENKDLETIWSRINAKCSKILLDYGSDEFFKVIRSVGLFALKTIHLKFDDQNYFDTISLLCNTLLSPQDGDDVVDDSEEELRSLISLVCEALWKESATGGNELMPNVVRHLVGKCLGAKPKMTSMTRLHSVRDSIRLVDFESEEGTTLRCLLLEVVSSGNLLKNDKGRKVLVVIFSLSIEIAKEVHNILKQMILTAPKSHLPWIAHAYMSAWKSAKEQNSPELVECMEVDCIGDLVYTMLHSPREGGFKSQFVQFFKVLSYLHKEKKSMNVASMLCRLYGRVLFRSLKVPNGTVRANAAFVLSDVFPLCDLDKGREVNERLLHEQLKALEDLLDDPNTKARQAAISGLFAILSSYWELVPTDKIKNFFEKVVRSSVRDVSSYQVRLCVVRGFVVLLDNCLAYPTLKKILPTLTNAFHDLNEKVRLATVDLLLKVKGLRDLKFWQIVPMEHLLARMEEDSMPVVKKLVTLLADTYAPPTASLPSQLNRCVKLFSANRTAARKFYLQLANSLDVVYGCKFVVYVLEKLSAEIQNSDASNNSLRSGQLGTDDADMHDQESQNGSAISFDKTDVVTHLCEAVFLLLVGMKKSLKESQNEKTVKILTKQIAKRVPNIIRRYQDVHSITNPLLLVCGRYNPKYFPTLSLSVVSKLSSLPEPLPELFELRSRSIGSQDQSEEDEIPRVEVLIELACRWKKVQEILNLIGESVLPVLDDPRPRRASTRVVNFQEPSESKPTLGVLSFVLLLRNKTCRSVVVSEHLGKLCEVDAVFKNVLVTIENRLISNYVCPFPAPLLVEILRAYLVVEVLLSKAKNDPDKLCASLEEVYCWLSNLLTRGGRKSRSGRKRRRNEVQSEEPNDSNDTCDRSLQMTSASATTTTFANDQDSKDMLLKGVLEVLTRMTHNFVRLELLNSSTVDMATDACSAILKSDVFASIDGGHVFSNILDVVAALFDVHEPSAVTLTMNVIKSLEMLLKKDLLKHVKSKVLVVMLKVHDLFVDGSCVGLKPIVEMFVLTAVESAADAFKEGHVLWTRDSDDDHWVVQCCEPPFLSLLIEVVNHKRIKTEFVLPEFFKLCEEVNELGNMENVAGLLAAVSHLTRIQKCHGDALRKCCQLLLSKCDAVVGNMQVDVRSRKTTILKWLKDETSWINKIFLNCSGINYCE